MSELAAWVRGLPKAELHVHLEGTMRPDAYRRIARRNGCALVADVEGVYRCHDFESFLSAFLQAVKVLQQPQDFYELTAEYLGCSAEEGVRHVELMVSPATLRYLNPGLAISPLIAAMHDAVRQARQASGISALIIFDMVRNLGESAALQDVDLALRCRGEGVVGVGLGGDEQNFPARDFQKAFARAKDAGLRRTAHAGEAAGADSIQEAVRLCQVERIGHGVAAIHSPETMRLLREHDISVEACLTSNDVTGAWSEQHAHPLLRFINDEVPVTLNSDDPAFFGASLSEEYMKAASLGLARSSLVELARTSFVYSFAAEADKRRWLAELDQFTAALPE